MKIRSAEFRAAATSPAQIPPASHPEVAVAGRSNVGKSSLLNRMTGRKGLARTSRTPGCTRGLLFYAINDELTLVDLPGYGYASRSKGERDAWKKLVEHYLSSRQELAGVLILADVRRGPEEEEQELAEYLESVGLPYAIVLTKIDKLKRGALSKQVAEVRKMVAPAIVLPTSAEGGDGIDQVWRWIRAAIETPPEDEAMTPSGVEGDEGDGRDGHGNGGEGGDRQNQRGQTDDEG